MDSINLGKRINKEKLEKILIESAQDIGIKAKISNHYRTEYKLGSVKKERVLKISTHYVSESPISFIQGQSIPLVKIEISDTGKGIPKNQLDFLFTPFFSTKAKGTGLGLMMTQRIIKEHHGSIKVKSEEKKGTTFHIYLKLVPN